MTFIEYLENDEDCYEILKNYISEFNNHVKDSDENFYVILRLTHESVDVSGFTDIPLHEFMKTFKPVLYKDWLDFYRVKLTVKNYIVNSEEIKNAIQELSEIQED